VPTHPLWRPFELVTEKTWGSASIRPRQPAPVVVLPYDPAWPEVYDEVRARLVGALGDRILSVEHVGSTAVPGLAAKPYIDVDLIVADSADEAAWVPDCEAVGFVLRVREPHWEEHRMLRLTDPLANVHVWSPGATEPARHRMFRDWLRDHPDDRDAYGALKADLGTQGLTDVMVYSNGKAELVYDLYEQAFAADPEHEHDPQPR
jgi:GrpB-like predicted nucleotidyltransferase (UPF0157 family)